MALAPSVSPPTDHAPVPLVYVPWLGVALTNVSPAGNASVTTTVVVGSGPLFVSVSE